MSAVVAELRLWEQTPTSLLRSESARLELKRPRSVTAQCIALRSASSGHGATASMKRRSHACEWPSLSSRSGGEQPGPRLTQSGEVIGAIGGSDSAPTCLPF